MKLVIDERIKHRLVGVAVILLIMAMFMPAIMKKSIPALEERTNLSVKLPPKSPLTTVEVAQEKVLFKREKVAHVEIPSMTGALTSAAIVAVEPVDEVNRAKVALATHSESSSDASPIKVNKENKVTDVVVKPIVVSVSKVTSPLKKLPIKTLAKASSTSTTTSSRTNVKVKYMVQLGTFSQKNNAELLVTKLRKKGYTVICNKTTSKKGVTFKVMVGRGANQKKDAIVLQQQLALALQIKGFVVPTTGVS